MSQEHGEIGERHLQLLQAAYDKAQDAQGGLLNIHQVGQKMGLETVGHGSDRKEFLTLARELEEAGYLQKEGPEQVESYGFFTVTEEGRKLIEEGSKQS